MTNQRMTRILCAGDPRGDGAALERVLTEAGDDFDAVAVVGDLGGPSGAFRAVFEALGRCGRPAYWVPGPSDAPIGNYLAEAHNMEIVFPQLRGVHGTVAVAPDAHELVAGIGGEVSDDPATPREELEALRYPRWEAEYRLKLLRDFGEHQTVLLFSTTPAHKGSHTGSSEVLAELIGTYRARLAVCAGPQAEQTLGRSLVVMPGSVADGQYAVAHVRERRADLAELTATAARAV
jgi:Icc-related predicted phosphoesterase